MRAFRILLPALLGLACGDSSAQPGLPPDPQAAPARSEPALRESVPIRREVPASVRSLDHIRVSAESAGRVLAVHADVGDRVAAGQLLAELDPSLQIASRDAASAALDLAQAEADRMRRLRDEHVASEQEYDRALTNLKRAQAELEAAETALARARVVSPVDGIVEQRLVGAGDLAVAGTPLFSLYDPARLCLEAHLPVSDRSHAVLGTELGYQVEDHAGTSPVSEVAPSSDPRSRTIRIRVPLPGAVLDRGELSPGVYGTLAYVVGSRDRVSVPAEALFRVGQVEMVRVRTDGGWVRRAVRTGATRDGRTEILAGLSGGEVVGLP